MLLIVSSFPPDISGGVYRPASLARYGMASGWRVTAVAPPAPVPVGDAGRALLDYVGRDCEVLRTPEATIQPSYKLFAKVDGSMTVALDMVRAARSRFGDELPSTIVASGPSFSTFVAGFLLARSCGSRLILEYRDEWTLCPFDFVAKGRSDRLWERRCVQRADAIVFTTQSQMEHFVREFGAHYRDRCEVIPNGWEEANAVARRVPGVRTRKELTLTFTGRLGGHADPTRFLAKLEDVLGRRPDWRGRIKVRFVGPKHSNAERLLAEFGVAGVVESATTIPMEQAVREMREADAVLLFHGPAFERYIPGKLYEYAASGATVLLFDDEGETARVVREIGLGYVDNSPDSRQLERILDLLWVRRAKGSAPNESGERKAEWLAFHTREVLAGRLFALAKKVIGAGVDNGARHSRVEPIRGSD